MSKMLVFTPYKRDFKRKQFNAPRPHKVTTPNVAASGRGLQSSPSVVNTVHSEVRRRRGSGLAREDVNAIGAKKKTPRRGVKFRLNGKINRYARGLKNWLFGRSNIIHTRSADQKLKKINILKAALYARKMIVFRSGVNVHYGKGFLRNQSPGWSFIKKCEGVIRGDPLPSYDDNFSPLDEESLRRKKYEILAAFKEVGIKQKKKEVGPISSRRLMLYKSIKAIQPFHPLKSGNVASWQLSGKQLLALRLSVLRARPARESSSSGATIVNKAVLKKACKHLRLANKVARELQKDVEHTEKIRLAHKYARRFSLSDLEDSVNIIRTAVHYREKLKADRLRSTKLKKFKAIMGDRSKKKLKLKTGRSVRAVKRLVNQLLRASRKRELLKRKRLEYSFRAIKRIFRVYSANIRRAGGDNDEAKMRRTETIVTAFETANFFVMEALFAVTRDDNVALVYSTKKSVESRIQRITNISNVKNNCGKFLTKEAALFTSVSLMVYLTLTFRQLIRELSKKPPRAAKSTVKKKKPVDTIGKLKALLGENLKSRRFIAGFLKLFLTRNTMLNLKWAFPRAETWRDILNKNPHPTTVLPTREFFKNDKEMQQVIGGYTIIQLLDRSFKPEDLKSNRKLRTGYFSARRKVPVELRKKEEDRRKLFELYAKKKAEWHKRIASLKKEYDARRLKRLDSGRAINHFSRPPSPYRAEKKSLRVGAKTGAGGRNSATSISSTGFIKNSDRVDLINRAPKGPAARSFSTLINSPRINNKSAGDSSTSWTIARSMTYYITRGHAQTFILRPSNRNTHLPDQRFFSLTPRPLLRHFNKRDGTNIVRRERGIGANDRRSNSRRLHWSRKTGWPGGLKMGPAHWRSRPSNYWRKNKGVVEVEIKSSPDEEKGFKVTGGYWKFFRKIFDQKEKTYFMQANSATVLKELPKGSRFNFGSLWKSGWKEKQLSPVAGIDNAPYTHHEYMGEFYRPSLPIRGSINNIVRLANSGSLEALNEKTLRGLSREVYPRNIDSKKRVAEVKVLAPSRKNAKGAAHSRKTLKKSDQYALDLHMTREKVASLNISAGNRLVSLHRWDDPSPSKTYEIEAKFVKDFIHNKKEVNGIIAFDPKLFGVKHDRVPLKYFHYNHAVDPVYGSFIFNKLINAFSKNGKKRKIRKLFYDIIEENRPDLSAGAFIHIIQSLKPAFINVKVRHGKLHSKAPIPASDVKATIKAIKFFKAAVYAHRHLDTLKEKIETEALDYLYWFGYNNNFYDDYVEVSKENLHARHYRSKNKY